MSTKHERWAQRQRFEQRARLDKIFAHGGGVGASAETPGQPTIHQTVYLRRAPDGAAAVHMEHHYPNEWDHTIDETEHRFATLAEALEWLESQCGISWAELHEPATTKLP
jgi:hypothetical protein